MRFLIVILFIALAGCAATEVQQVPEIDKIEYTKIFENLEKCDAIYQTDNLLVITKGRPRGHRDKYKYVLVYNIDNGVFFTETFGYTGVVNSADHTCSSLHPRNFNKTTTHFIFLSVVVPSSFRALFENAPNDPLTLLSAIETINNVNLRNNGTWKGEKVLGLRDRHSDYLKKIELELGEKEFSDIINNFKSIPPERLAELSLEMVEMNERVIRKRQREIIEKKLREEAINNAWAARFNRTINVGDRVCTFHSNLFGYAEEVHGNRIRTYIVGKSSEYPRFFFSNSQDRFRYEKIEGYRWFNREELGHCSFAIN